MVAQTGSGDWSVGPGCAADGCNETPPPAVTPPPVVPGFELGELLARGATSEVWAAADLAGARRVVVKVVDAALEAVEAAAREASVSARAASAHVVTIEACLPMPDGRVALVMPHLRGGSLDALVRARGHLTPGEVVTVLTPVASAIGRLHDLGVVHGDVSPGNVLLDLDGRPLIGDLGLSHVVGDVSPGVWGTDGYVAPEVVLGAAPTRASDVYALGALGWLCLTGEVPGPSCLRPPLADLNRAGTGAEAASLVGVLEAAAAPEPGDRPTAHELAWQLFGAADPVPLDLVRADDAVSAVTYRLRAAAGSDPEAEPATRWRVIVQGRRLRRGAGGRAGSAAAGLRLRRATEPRDGRPQRARHAGAIGSRGRVPSRVTALGPAVLAIAVPVALVLGVAAVGGEDREAEAHALVRPPAAGPAPTGDPVAVQPPTPVVPTAPLDPRMDPEAPRHRPVELLEALAGHRAAAWREAAPAHLRGADAPGSSAALEDAAAVVEMARAGLRYTGLRYSVREAAVVTATTGRAVLRARIDTSAYAVAGASGSSPRPAVRGDAVLVDLARTAVGWRVSDVRPAS